MSSSTLTRRALTRGAAWSVPTLPVASAAPAMAASQCTPASQAATDAAFADLLTKQGSLMINFYQSVQSANGFVGESWLNLRNDSDVPLRFTAEHPLTLRVEVVGLTGPKDTERAGTWPSTSWGTIARGDFNTTTGTRTYTWTFAGEVPAYKKGDNEADFWFHWQDGITRSGRITNEVRVTPLTTPPPTLESITSASGQAAQCQSYYDSKMAAYDTVAKRILLYADGSKNSGSSDRYGDQSVALGQTVSSSAIGDFRPAGADDGIY